MRGLILLAAALLGGCAAPIGRNGLPIGLGQAACELIPGNRCCRRPPLPPPPPIYCTRTLGVPDCWSDPSRLPDQPHPLVDTPIPPYAPGCG